MASRKNPNSLSDRQIRRKVAAEKISMYLEARKHLTEYRKNTKDKHEPLKVSDDSIHHVDIKSNSLANRVNFECLAKFLCREDWDDGCDEILKDIENQLFEKQSENPQEVTHEPFNTQKELDELFHDNGCSDQKDFNFFEIIKEFTHDDDEADDCEDEAYFEELLSLRKEDPKLVFINKIRAICIKYIHTLPHTCINDLLRVLREETGYPFPKDARTFLKTPRESIVHKMGEGEYCHYGIASAITTFLSTYKINGVNVDCIRLLANIDGAQLANSTEKGSWIISVSETILNLVEVVGIYEGMKKPKDSDDLTRMFVDELTYLINNGILFENKQYQVAFHCLICDAPAKAYIMKTKLYSGYYSCSKCTIEGDYQNKVFFPTSKQEGTVLRTDEKFLNQEYEASNVVFDEFQQGETYMKKIPGFRPISDVVLDYMHLICLGVMLKLIELWIQSPKCCLSECERKLISELLLSFAKHMPSDFSRNPRQFQNVRRLWKAHELRSFLLYTGPVVLFKILPIDFYLNFLCLHVAISILVNPILCKDNDYLSYAEKLLNSFVNSYEKLYGRLNMVYNIHNVLHLVNDVRRFGSLDKFSAFRYENHIGKVRQLIRKGDKRLQQIGNRIMEIKAAKDHCEDNAKETNFELQPSRTEFLVIQHKFFKIDCRNEKDKYVLLDDGTYLECKYFMKEQNGLIRLVGHPLRTTGCFYSVPLSSSYLNIRIVSSKRPVINVSYESVFAKVCKLPLKNESDEDDTEQPVRKKKKSEKFVMIPLIHTYKQN